MPFGSRSTAAHVAAGHDLRGRNALVTGGAAGLGARDGPGAGRSRGDGTIIGPFFRSPVM